MHKNIIKISKRGIAMAMGIAVIVMSTLKTLEVDAGVSMIGRSLTASALSNFPD